MVNISAAMASEFMNSTTLMYEHLKTIGQNPLKTLQD